MYSSQLLFHVPSVLQESHRNHDYKPDLCCSYWLHRLGQIHRLGSEKESGSIWHEPVLVFTARPEGERKQPPALLGQIFQRWPQPSLFRIWVTLKILENQSDLFFRQTDLGRLQGLSLFLTWPCWCFAVGTDDKPLSIEKEGVGASRETSIHSTQSLGQSKSYLRQERGSMGTGKRLPFPEVEQPRAEWGQ